MSRPKMLLSVLIALVVASACTSAVASAALPELRGDFYPMKYSGSTGNATWEVAGGLFKCVSGGPVEGEITGVKRMTAVLHFGGCAASGSWCTSEGAKTGEIITQPLEGTPVYLKKGESGKMAIVFKPQSGESIVNKFNCVGGGVVRGSVIATVNNARWEHTTELKLSFTQTGGIQYPTEYVNEEGSERRASLETTWLGGGSFHSLGWGFADTLQTFPKGEELGVIEIAD